MGFNSLPDEVRSLALRLHAAQIRGDHPDVLARIHQDIRDACDRNGIETYTAKIESGHIAFIARIFPEKITEQEG